MNEQNRPDDDLMRDVDAVLRQGESATEADAVQQDRGSLVLMAMGQIDALVMQKGELKSHVDNLHQKLLNKYATREYFGEPLYSGDPTALDAHMSKLVAYQRAHDSYESARYERFTLTYRTVKLGLDTFKRFEHVDGRVEFFFAGTRSTYWDGTWDSGTGRSGNPASHCVPGLEEVVLSLREIANARRKCEEIDERIASYKKLMKSMVGLDLDGI